MKKIVFATNNPHKLAEVKNLLRSHIQIVSLEEISYNKEIPETRDTLEGNAMQKAETIHRYSNLDVFADDTGLEVEALNGAPGVFSARYAGENATFRDNVNKLLNALKGEQNRKARFRTVIALILDGQQHFFEGRVDGEITLQPSGEKGFGYDPVFKPDGYDETFAEMGLGEKNKISHRGRAVKKLVDFFGSSL